MFTGSAAVYDLIYGGFKNYAEEATLIAEWIERYRPGATTLLDVACGTGAHAALLAARGYSVTGIDLNPQFIAIAQEKVPDATFTVADMTAFDLGRKFDAVICMFSSIGYARTLDRAAAAIRSCAEHLDDNGVMLVEPWFTPEQWRPGHIYHNTGERDGVIVSRMGESGVDSSRRVSSITFSYLLGEPGKGVRHFTETHELGLFTVEEMLALFRRAGLDVVHEVNGVTDRGLYIARHRRTC